MYVYVRYIYTHTHTHTHTQTHVRGRLQVKILKRIKDKARPGFCYKSRSSGELTLPLSLQQYLKGQWALQRDYIYV